MDSIDMSSLQARDLYERTRVQRDLSAARQRARTAGGDAITTPVVRRSEIDRQSKLYKAAQDFEAIFVKQMLNSMRKTVNKSGLVDGGMAEEIFEDMLYDEYATKMTRVAGFGLADQIYLQLTRDAAPGK